MSQRKRIFQVLITSVFIIIYFSLWVLFKNTLIYQQQSLIIKLAIVITSGLVLYYSMRLIFTNVNKRQMIVFITSYVIIIYILLLHRTSSSDQNISTNFYLWKWLNLLFTNQTVFINVIGNAILFIPLGLIIGHGHDKWYLKIVFCLLIIVTIELLQYILQKGIFDYIDIILNTLGALIGIVISMRKDNIYEQKR